MDFHIVKTSRLLNVLIALVFPFLGSTIKQHVRTFRNYDSELPSNETSQYHLIMKANEMHYFSNFLDKVLYMFRTCPLSIIRSISTLYYKQ